MILAILQARMSSSRLPGKVLRPLMGEPMIGRQLERLRRAERLDRLVVATSAEPGDDPLHAYVRGIGVEVFRGDLNDVLARFDGAARAFGPAQQIVRLTADCPLADPGLIDRCVSEHLETGADYTNNSQGWTFPKGLDVEVCRADVLKTVAREATSAYDREHVTPFIYNRPDRFKIHAVTRSPALRYRWTVDTSEDFAFVSAVYQDLYPANRAFGSEDVLAWQARHPDQVIPNRTE